MITVEDKIRTFSKYVYDKEVKKSNELVKEIEDKNKEILETKHKDIEAKCISLNSKMNKKIEMDTQKIISKAKIEAKNSALNAKKDLLEKFTQEIITSFESFANDEAYTQYIAKIIEDIHEFLSTKGVKLSMIKKDIQRFASDIEAKYKGVEIVQMSDDHIGGIIVEVPSTQERMDYTIKRRVNDWKREIGLRLYEALEK